MTGRLAEAVVTLRYRQITALLDKGVNINGRSDDGRTPLMYALDVADPDKRQHMFRYLVHHGAEMLESDNDDVTVFQQCCRRAFLDLMEIILKKAGVSAVNLMGRDKLGRTPLYHAVTSEDVEVVHTVLDNIDLRQQSVDVPDYNGLTPLLYAKQHGLESIAEALIERGNANPRICDRQNHMNADEWAAAAERRRRKENARAKKHAKERYMIFPPIDHATRRKEKIASKSKMTASLPNLSEDHRDVKSKKPHSQPKLTLPSLSSPSVSPNSVTNGQDVDFRTKSIDSAITLLSLASRAADEKEYASSFISSSSQKPNGVNQTDQKTNTNNNNRNLDRTWTHMMDAYTIQKTNNFRKPYKPPQLPEINEPDEGSDKPGKKPKMSTLAIILRAGRGGKNSRKTPRGKNGKGKHHDSSDDGDHGPPGKLTRHRSSTLTTINGGGGESKRSALPDLIEDDSEHSSGKKRKHSTRKHDTLPNIVVT